MSTPAEIIKADEVLRQALGLPVGDFKFGFRVNVFNWRMRKLREMMGLTQVGLGEEVKVSGCTISKIETFKRFPDPSLAEGIAQALRTTTEALFPEWLRFYLIDKSSRELVSTTLEVQQALERSAARRALRWGGRLASDEAWEPTMVKPAIGDSVAEAEKEQKASALDTAVRQVIETLTPREQKVLILRFGLGEDPPKTLEEVGRAFDVTRERIRGIEAKALRKLRHPARSRHLRPLLSTDL